MSYRFKKITAEYIGPGQAVDATEVTYTGVIEINEDSEIALVWDAVLGNVRLLTDAEKLQRAKRRARKHLRVVANEKFETIYEGIAAGDFLISRDVYQHVKPASRNPMSGDLLAAQQVRQAYRDKRNEINALATMAEVLAYDFAAGWP